MVYVHIAQFPDGWRWVPSVSQNKPPAVAFGWFGPEDRRNVPPVKDRDAAVTAAEKWWTQERHVTVLGELPEYKLTQHKAEDLGVNAEGMRTNAP